jgi:hypothetical protein
VGQRCASIGHRPHPVTVDGRCHAEAPAGRALRRDTMAR